MLKNKITKLISAFLIISILMPAFLFSLPKQANATFCPPSVIPTGQEVPVKEKAVAGSTGVTCITTVKGWIEYLLKEALKAIARKALEKVTNSIVSWINSDFHGQPLFLENPTSFFKDIAKSELKKYVDLFGYDLKMFPFGRDFALNAINAYRSTLQKNTSYTLNNILNQQEGRAFRGDFSVGGWNGLISKSQFPQNNPLGFQFLAAEELNNKLLDTIQAPAQQVNKLLQQGQGFLSPQTCPSNPNYPKSTNPYNPPSYDQAGYDRTHQWNPPLPQYLVDAEGYIISENPAYTAYKKNYEADAIKNRGDWDEKNTCPKGLVNTTPGAVVASQITTALTSHIRNKELSAALGNSFSIIFDALLNHFLEKGLNALSNSINPPPDNWSYDGNTLDGRVPGDLILPQNVSVNVGQTTSTNISGGTAPYLVGIGGGNPAVATAAIARNALAVTGVAPGETTIAVKDSSSPEKTASVHITIVSPGGLMVIPANIVFKTNDSITASISGGKEPYSIVVGPDETIATALYRDTALIIYGVDAGDTSISIKDSSGTPKIVTVNIKVIGQLIIQQNVPVRVGQVKSANIYGGTAPFTIKTPPDAAVATATISGNTLNITGVALGETAVIVKDSFSPEQTAKVQISVSNTPDPTQPKLGTCVAYFPPSFLPNIKINILQPACFGVNPQWIANK